MTIPVVWVSYRKETPARFYWDQGMIEGLFSHELWRPVGTHDFEHLTSLEGLEGAVVVFPAPSQVDYVDRLQNDLQKLKWVVLILTSDEEGVFPANQLSHHPNMRLWVMYPRKNRYPETPACWEPVSRQLPVSICEKAAVRPTAVVTIGSSQVRLRTSAAS